MTQRLQVIPELDSFRFFAVVLVIISHWVPGNIINIIPNGFIGVNFFFVLSGFLISFNLLCTKRDIDNRKISILSAFKIFYIRRTLRIFPLYYFVLIILYLIIPAVFNGSFSWYIGYIPNFLFYKNQHWGGMLSHFWSLGVEEQFYIIWPLFLFLIRWSWLKYAIPGIILLSIFFKMFFYFYYPHTLFYDTLPISCFDAFGVGAFLAYRTITNNSSDPEMESKLSFKKALLLFLSLFLFLYVSKISFLFGISISLLSFYLIKQAIVGYKGFFGGLVSNSILTFLGKISYGLYVYHNLIPWLLRCLTGKESAFLAVLPVLRWHFLDHPLPLLIVQFILLVLIASLSWFLLENPFNKLKKHFA